MGFHIACPECQQTLAVDEQDRGTVIACSRCGKRMRIPGNGAQESPAHTYRQAESARRPAFSRTEPEEEPDYDRPRRRRSRYEDDEDDYRPARQRKQGSSVGMWLGISSAVVAVVAIVVVVLVFALKKSGPTEAGRHYERAGRFSYMPIPGWQIRDFPGLQFKVIVGPVEPGFGPNVNFIPENSHLPIADYTDANITTLKAMFPNLRFLGKQPFTTDKGLQGFKLIHENQQGNLLLRQCQYMFGNGNQKIVITGSVPANAGARFDAAIDACARSFQFE